MKKIIKILLLIAIICLFAYLYYNFKINITTGSNTETKNFKISTGQSVDEISDNLLEQGHIGSKLFFKLFIWQTGKQDKLQAGEYQLNKDLSAKEIASLLISGDTVDKERSIKIIEGWDIDDIDRYLANEKIISENEFSRACKASINNWQFSFTKHDFLNKIPPNASLEGYLFPDTYRIFNDATSEDIAKKMLDNFEDKVTNEMLNEISQQGKNIHEIVIMASIVEKEVRTAKDMKIVSGIFWDRIKIGQALQSDATLSYYLGDKKSQHTLEETQLETPYNTYRYQGLPPSPICNPGLNAITAAIYPENTEYNYFLNRQDTGETIFSKTFEEHIENKVKYLK